MSSRRTSSGRPVASQRSSRRKDDEDLVYECKAAYLVVKDSLSESLESRKQLFQALQQTGRNPTRKMIEKFWPDRTDSMDFEEFCDVCRRMPATTEDDLLKAFRKIDINGDGYLSNSELRRVLTTKGEKMTEKEVQDIIDEVDENRDGRLDYQEFCKMLLTTQNECKKVAISKMEKKTKKSRTSSSPRPAEPTNGHSLNGSHSDLKDSPPPPSARSSKLGSQASLGSEPETEGKKKDTHRSKYDDSDEDSDDVVIGSQASLNTKHKKDQFGSQASLASLRSVKSVSNQAPTPKPRKSKPGTSSHTKEEDRGHASPRTKEYTRAAVSSKDLKLPAPKKLKNWKMTHRKGSFFFEENGVIISHQYDLKLSRDTSVWITIEPFSLRPGGDLNSAREMKRAPIDTMLMVLRDDGSLATFTEMRDIKGKYGVRCDLDRGTYQLIPMTTGCRFKPRTSDPNSETKLVKKKDDTYVLTKAFKDALADVFELCDLDGNGHLSKEEFGLFNLRTSGDRMTDEEWSVVNENVELKNGELTRKGFIDLNQMEAEDNEGDTEDLWVTLNSMGFNKNLVMDEACPFFLEVFNEEGDANIKVTGLAPPGATLDTAVIEATIGKGEAMRVKNMRDLNLHTYMTDFRACLVLENTSRSRVRVELDCSKSKNCASNRRSLVHMVEVPARSSVIGHHLMPVKETLDWTVRCQEAIVK